jgi:hypothetical protein
MTVEVDVVEREPDDVMLARHWIGKALASSSGVGGACKIRVFRRSTYVECRRVKKKV